MIGSTSAYNSPSLAPMPSPHGSPSINAHRGSPSLSIADDPMLSTMMSPLPTPGAFANDDCAVTETIPPLSAPSPLTLRLSPSESPQKDIVHHSHCHSLCWTQRADCELIICDLCSREFQGRSWHCTVGCDFDLCSECVAVGDTTEIVKVPKCNQSGTIDEMGSTNQEEDVGSDQNAL